MDAIAALKQELVTANRILAKENVLDSFGHISVRHPDHADRFFMSRARAPEVLVEDDILEMTLEGVVLGPVPSPGKPYSERFIHGAIFEARPDVMSVVHNHSPSVIPFSVTGKRMRPIMHMCAPIGNDIPTWDIRNKFGETNLLVTNMAMARDLALTLGKRTVSLMRGHGSVVVGKSIREVVFTSNYMEKNADMLIKSLTISDDVQYLSDGEVDIATRGRAGFTFERGWENWCNKVARPYVAQDWEMGPGFSQTDK